MPALLAVISAFMAGLAIGAWIVSRMVFGNSAQAYAWLELGIGAWTVCTAFMLPIVNRFASHWIGIDPSPLRHWSVAFLVPLFVLLPATAAMGATLPVIERFITPISSTARSVAGLYAANTLGAVAGVLVSTFFVLPWLGLRASLFAFAALNVSCAVIAFFLSRRSIISGAPPHAVPVVSNSLLPTLFITGLLGIGFEIVGARLLAQVLEGTVYTYAAVLAIFLLGTSLGAAVYQRLRPVPANNLLSLTAVACVIAILIATQADELYRASRNSLGDSVSGVLVSELIVSSSVFLIPTAFMGATFSQLVHCWRWLPGGIARAVAINTLGAAAAPILFSVVMLPRLGTKWTLLVIAAGYVLLSRPWQRWRKLTLAAVALLALMPESSLRFVTVPSQGRLLQFKEGVAASVAVVEDALAHKTLRVDNRYQMGGTGVADAEYRHAHIPLLLHPQPRRALFLGLGTGITFAGASLHTNLVADGVELLPEVMRVSRWFEPFNVADPGHRQLIADARRFVSRTTNSYDVIVGDLFHPARDGAASLYTVEHFRAIRRRLDRAGLFCQWLPVHQLETPTLHVIIRTFLEVFPDTQAWLLRFNVETPVVGLVGFVDAPPYTHDWIERRHESPALAARLQKLALGDSLRLFGNLLCGSAELRAMAGSARLNTDDNLAVLFAAPEFTYRRDADIPAQLAPFLTQQPNTESILGFHSRDLDHFITARNVFLRGLMEEAAGNIDAAAAAYVESARLSEKFTAGYARVITMAASDSRSRPENSRRLLHQLIDAQPDRPLAKQLLERLRAQSATQP